jgi:hypothetical protein
MNQIEFDEMLRQRMIAEIRDLEVKWNCIGRWIRRYE